VFLEKAEEAQNLLEPPRLASLVIQPEHPVLKPGGQIAFACSALDQYGHAITAPAVAWSASGGSVTPDGGFTAGSSEGLYTVQAVAGDREAVAEIRVRAEGREGSEGDGRAERPDRRVIRWRGTIPPQKWMNFYTKVLTRFVSSPELKLEVSFEIPLDGAPAQAKVKETRCGLKELGLDESGQLA
jgi:hypothetical protein